MFINFQFTTTLQDLIQQNNGEVPDILCHDGADTIQYLITNSGVFELLEGEPFTPEYPLRLRVHAYRGMTSDYEEQEREQDHKDALQAQYEYEMQQYEASWEEHLAR